MPMLYSVLLGAQCDTESEDWRHECECRWLIQNKPDSSALHLYLYGVEQRARVITRDTSGQERLLPEHARLWNDPKTKPLTAYRGLQAADRLLNDIQRLKTLESKTNARETK
jgi:hypothetical protein